MGKEGVGDGKLAKAWDAATGGLTNGTAEERNAALNDLGDFGKTVTETAKAGLETGRDLQKYASAYRAASNSLKADAPGLNDTGRRSLAHNIAKTTFNKVDAGDELNGKKFNDLYLENRTAAKNIGSTAHQHSANQTRKVLGMGADKGFKAADNALKAGIHAGAKAAGSGLAKAAGRFVPGANVAIAAFDTAKAISTWNSKSSNPGEIITAGITALGSIAAATNIPVVSQVGAAVSSVSDFVGSFF
ncbi:cell wall anchor protein [Archangium minus]|uniref:Cell wall anchor protein n=2 Tax=Archangium minus TaxID=83450 RepID=A0ABY9XAH6_9BACT|nr:cell wall anchor protein [Archangium minus]